MSKSYSTDINVLIENIGTFYYGVNSSSQVMTRMKIIKSVYLGKSGECRANNI